MSRIVNKSADAVAAWKPEVAIATRNLVILGAIGTIVATLFNAVAFSTHNWLEGPGHERSPFTSLGFHEICFHDCRAPYCPGGDYTFVYDGCSWIHSERYMELWDWLLPDWYMKVRELSITSVPLTLVCMGLAIGCACAVILCCRTGGAEICSVILLYFTAAALFATGLLLLIVLGSFRLHAFQLTWMPMPDRNKLGYSFWLDMVATVLIFLSFMALFLAAVFKTMWRTAMHPDPGAGIDMMLGGT